MGLGISLQSDGNLRYTTQAFNRLCYLLAGVWITGSLMVSLRVSPIESASKEYHDFAQFYMGGLIARHHAWDALYPIPKPQSVNSPGESRDSDMWPRYADLATQAGVPADSTRFIQPPPFALFMEPFARLKYALAKQAWKLLSVLCVWGVAIQGGFIVRRCAQRQTRLSGITAMLIAMSPLTLDTLRILNVTPLISLIMGWAILGLLQKHAEGGAVALVLGAASKYATVVMLPLYVAMRRWRALIVMAVVGMGIIGGSIAIMGTGPLRIFFHDMAPTFGRVHTDPWNRSLGALLMQVTHASAPLHGLLQWIVQGAQWVCLLAIMAAIFTRKLSDWRHPPTVLAGAAALLSWFLIFSPIVWDHYFMYFMPLWGWLLWEARRHWLKTIAVALVLGYENLPRWVVDSRTLEVLQNRSATAAILISGAMVFCAGVTLLLATARLLRREESLVEPAISQPHIATAGQFNRWCYAATALWLVAIVPFSLRVRTMGRGDFPQFYMGGVMARLHAWQDLYPTPKPGSVNNPGMPEDSIMRPRYAAERIKRNVDDGPRFIQPPQMAFLLMPLGYLKYPQAYAVWILLLMCCGWGVGYCGGKVYESLRKRPSIGAGLMMLLIVCSPLMLHAIRVANMSVMIGLLIGVATLGLVRQWNFVSGWTILLGAASKYTPVVLLPLAVVMRRWITVLWVIIASTALLGATVAVCGTGPFHTYFREILPTLARVHGIDTNQSVWAFTSRLLGHPILPVGVKLLILAAQAILVTLVLWLILRQPVTAWSDAGHVYAAATTLLGTFLIFSPIFWEHYPVYFCPLWGWMLWESWQSKRWIKLPPVVVGIALIYVPWTYLYDWPEPYNTHMLFGTVLLMAPGIWKLCERSVELEGAAGDHQRPILPDVQEQPGCEKAGEQTAAAEADERQGNAGDRREAQAN